MSLYEVEKILDKRKVGQKIMYYVKWKDYDENEATWEPVGNLKMLKI